MECPAWLGIMPDGRRLVCLAKLRQEKKRKEENLGTANLNEQNTIFDEVIMKPEIEEGESESENESGREWRGDLHLGRWEGCVGA